MRLVQVMVPTGKLEGVLATLDDEGIDYAVTDETSRREFVAMVSFPLPQAAVESVLDQLRDAGIEEDAYTVVVNAETVISRRFDKLEERYEEDQEAEDRISREELHSRAEDLAPDLSTFVVMTVVSAIVATAGVLIDSPAVVVGSMVIAPLVGPAVSTSVGTVVDDDEMFRNGVKLQVLGVLVAVVAAAVFAYFVRVTGLVPILSAEDLVALGQFEGRLSPDFLSLVVALGAGVAGALSVATGVSVALVGVMIAAALVPPIAVVGIGVAWSQPMTIVTASVLVLVNVLSINLAALVVLWYKGYRPNRWFREDDARRDTLRRVAALVVVIAVLSLFLGSITYVSYQSATFQQGVRADVNDVVGDEGQYSNVSLLGLEFEYTDTLPFREVSRVTVTVARPSNVSATGLADTLYRRVNNRSQTQFSFLPGVADSSVAVEVQYIMSETVVRTNATGSANDTDVARSVAPSVRRDARRLLGRSSPDARSTRRPPPARPEPGHRPR